MKFHTALITALISITASLVSHSAHAQEPTPLPVTKGLHLDLNAKKGVEIVDGNRVKS